MPTPGTEGEGSMEALSASARLWRSLAGLAKETVHFMALCAGYLVLGLMLLASIGQAVGVFHPYVTSGKPERLYTAAECRLVSTR